MISIDNFKKIEDWPTYGFLYGDNILSNELFNTLNSFDFNTWPITDPMFPDRKAITTNSDIDCNIVKTLHSLKEYVNTFSIVETLINKSFEESDMAVERFWNNGVQSVKKYQRNVFVQFVEDLPGLLMAPHADHREVLCNMQIYISPNEPNIGTKFYQTGNYENAKVAPFVPNCGYFSFNTHLSIHSVHNTSVQKRKSIIISWTM